MANTIKQREYLFLERPKRARPLMMLSLIGAASLGAAFVHDKAGSPAEEAAIQPDHIFVAYAEAAETETPRVYGALGGPERFVLEPTERGALMRFLCKPSETACSLVGGERGGDVARLSVLHEDGVTTYSDMIGVPVLEIADAGAALLLGGSAVVPDSVPKRGRTVLPTERTALSLASL